MEIARFWGWVSRLTLRGLLVLVPLAITLMFVIWLSRNIEEMLAPVVLLLLPEGWYLPGLGLFLFLVGAFVIGLLTRNTLLRKVGEALAHLVEITPVVGKIYPVVRQVVDLLGGSSNATGGQVVMVEVPGLSAQVFGIVLRRGDTHGCDWLPPDCDLVYTPMSYQIGGYALVIERKRLHPLALGAAEALQMILMGGIGAREAAPGAPADQPSPAPGKSPC